MRSPTLALLVASFLASACTDPAPSGPRLVIEPDDGRGFVLEAIAGATSNIRLTIYEITDLQSVQQTPPAPANGVVQALIDAAHRGVSIRVIVDQGQYGSGSSSQQIQQTVGAMRNAGIQVNLSSTAFCVTHQKTFVIDGPASGFAGGAGKALILSLNLMPGYFGGTRDYAVVTGDQGVVQEVSRVFDSDFALPDPQTGCAYAYTPATTSPPPSASDTPALGQASLLFSPVNSKPRLLEIIGGARQSLSLTTEELGDDDMICALQAVALSAARPAVRILLSGDTGSNAAAVKTLLGLGLPNLSIRVMPGVPPPSSAPSFQTPLYMHGKQVIADGARAFVGSENLTNTSLIQNRELGTFFTDPGMIERLQATFTSDFTTAGNSLPAQACASGSQCVTVSCPPGSR
jgi:phosphatidylserine/phosphatidylglycerophosphate/cardiolipin synthase-like enzyme